MITYRVLKAVGLVLYICGLHIKPLTYIDLLSTNDIKHQHTRFLGDSRIQNCPFFTSSQKLDLKKLTNRSFQGNVANPFLPMDQAEPLGI